eukprot:TRINITY_DN8255_c0_g1_i2.p1 TRINITY_DN8255_c0_g1~~TRINITY_DN8255_c0_g1_i2.p1  ORF type:complete len:111 (-),score=19.90 TRINITY_DN8255_c0_g1_i2:103-435(-)
MTIGTAKRSMIGTPRAALMYAGSTNAGHRTMDTTVMPYTPPSSHRPPDPEHLERLSTPRVTPRPARQVKSVKPLTLSLIHISEPTRLLSISYAVFCLKKKTSCEHTTSKR